MNIPSNRLIIGLLLWLALLIFGVSKSVSGCRQYKAEAKVWKDSTAYYKVVASRDCQTKIESMKIWYQQQTRQDAETIQRLTDSAPLWLR